MASAIQTYEDVIQAAKRLPQSQRQSLVQELSQMQAEESAADLLEKLGPDFRMPPANEKRMSKLLAKAKEGPLTADEQTELEDLVNEYDLRRLELARAAASEPIDGRSPPSSQR